MPDSSPDLDPDGDIPIEVDLSEPRPSTPSACMSREEQDSMRALSDTTDEMEKLARTLYKMVSADPKGARTRSSDKFRAVNVPNIQNIPDPSKPGG